MMRSLHQQIMRDLAEVGYPEPVRTEIVSGSIHPLEFRRHRLQERLRDGRTAYHVRLHFAVEISGPVSLGALSHFGLGHFNRVGSADPDDSDVIARYEPSIPAS